MCMGLKRTHHMLLQQLVFIQLQYFCHMLPLRLCTSHEFCSPLMNMQEVIMDCRRECDSLLEELFLLLSPHSLWLLLFFLHCFSTRSSLFFAFAEFSLNNEETNSLFPYGQSYDMCSTPHGQYISQEEHISYYSC